MRRTALLVTALLAGLSASGQAARRRPPGGIEVARLVWTEGDVQLAPLIGTGPARSGWQRAARGEALRTGDAVRTTESALARVEFPWMEVTLGPGSTLSVPAKAVLSTVLEQGRAEFSGSGRDIVKIEVAGAEVRGGGRLVLWRTAGRTSATALAGAFRIRSAGRSVEIKAGEGTFLSDGTPPEPATALPASPERLKPGAEVGYVRAGRPVELRWTSAGGSKLHHVELLALEREEVLLARETGGSSLQLQIPWLGTFRWRVSARDGRGLESRPSAPGVVCSVER
ncbi:MAG TPA: hypothetical protein VEQ10_20700 [Vicinamibacteria bacterium]|nr:hypothetical protein [Vicinamibacteria bacterium]